MEEQVLFKAVFPEAVLLLFYYYYFIPGSKSHSSLLLGKASDAPGLGRCSGVGGGSGGWGAKGGQLSFWGKKGRIPRGCFHPSWRHKLSSCPILLSHIWWLSSSKMTQNKQSSNPLLSFSPSALNKNTSGLHLHGEEWFPRPQGRPSQTSNCLGGLRSKALFICTANKLLTLVLWT